MVAKSIESLMEPRVGIPLRQYAALLGTYLRPQMWLVTVVTVLLFSGIGLQLLNPQILRYFIDEALAGSPLERLILAASLFTVVALVQQFLSIFATYVGGRVGWTATNALRGDLARHCLSLDMSFHNEHTPGEMIERIDGDANQLGGFFSTFVIQILGNAVLLVGILVLLFREDWRAGLALTLFAAFTVFVIYRIKKRYGVPLESKPRGERGHPRLRGGAAVRGRGYPHERGEALRHAPFLRVHAQMVSQRDAGGVYDKHRDQYHVVPFLRGQRAGPGSRSVPVHKRLHQHRHGLSDIPLYDFASHADGDFGPPGGGASEGDGEYREDSGAV